MASLQGTTFGWHHDGITLGAFTGTAISNQNLIGTSGGGNYWKGDGTAPHTIVNETYNDGAATSPTFFVENATGYLQPTENFASASFSAVAIQPLGLSSIDCNPNQGISAGYFDTDFWESLIEGNLYTGINEEQINFNLKRTLYSKLRHQPDLSEGSTLLTNFMDTLQSEYIVSFYRIDSLTTISTDTSIDINTRESIRLEALNQNDEIDAYPIYITNIKSVNDIFLRSFIKNRFILNSSDSIILRDIANSCPFTNGSAVYSARVMLKALDPSLYWDDLIICNSSPKIDELSTSSSNRINLYPNPSTGEISVSFAVPIESGCLMQLFNSEGKKIYNSTYLGKTSFLKLNFKYLPAGMYQLQFVDHHSNASVKFEILK